ncbi:SDR family oxidoreductase [Hahella aquimaris]|uniref:SDR family NAD(P)-dependent oxidoreductase n=1 Tax=Hahella sp. HNIBRBA332 TaxID=3015983 RepID=UPI00273B807C|nr:SDR family oxidoreductase [Hahella sp. HNIBRBA332]WLQ11281.1 SDR family oxidoreductase [Hahella sp. HNIBRBA332]
MSAKTVLITGASSGIGLALARVFARNGWNLALVARRSDNLERLATELKEKYGADSQCIGFDLTADNAARALYDEVRFRNLRIDCLVNNAGRGYFGSFIERDYQLEEETIYLNVTVLTSLCKLFGRDMVEQGGGRILNIASIAGFMPGPNFAVYHATKAYVLSLSRAIHAELKSQGVTVTASCPGPTETEFFDKAGTGVLKAMEYIRRMPAEKVAEQAYEAMMKGKPVVVHGMLNKVMVESPRLVPKSWVAPVVKSLMR